MRERRWRLVGADAGQRERECRKWLVNGLTVCAWRVTVCGSGEKYV
jgi:hypothetical protein